MIYSLLLKIKDAKVLYEHRPTAIENTGATTEDTQELDLDDELCSLMPILVAAYVWIEDDGMVLRFSQMFDSFSMSALIGCSNFPNMGS